MASLRKRYQGRVELEPSAHAGGSHNPRPSENLPPTAHPTNLKITEAAPPEPAEPVVESSDPVRDAEQSAMKQRLAELQRAETVQRQAAAHPQMAQEEQTNPIDALLSRSGLPERAQTWLRAHPEFLTDARKNSALQHHHWTCADECEPYSDEYYNKMESLLGLRSAPKMPSRAPEPQQRQASAPVSAPVSRESPSWSSGRPASESTLKLTAQDRELAAMWNLSEQEYLAAKQRVAREKAAGFHQDGR
jgi:hypothetical protein